MIAILYDIKLGLVRCLSVWCLPKFYSWGPPPPLEGEKHTILQIASYLHTHTMAHIHLHTHIRINKYNFFYLTFGVCACMCVCVWSLNPRTYTWVGVLSSHTPSPSLGNSRQALYCWTMLLAPQWRILGVFYQATP